MWVKEYNHILYKKSQFYKNWGILPFYISNYLISGEYMPVFSDTLIYNGGGHYSIVNCMERTQTSEVWLC